MTLHSTIPIRDKKTEIMSLFHNLPLPAIRILPDTMIIEANKMAQTQFGLADMLSEEKQTLFCDMIADQDKAGFFEFLNNSHVENSPRFRTTLSLPHQQFNNVSTTQTPLEDSSHVLILNRCDPHTGACNPPCQNHQILEAQYQYNPGGILIVNSKMEMLTYNQQFLHMWDISREIQASRDERASLFSMASKVKNQDEFVTNINSLYRQPYKSQTDEIHLQDGRVFYRNSYPIFTREEYLGRVWYFLDITELHRNREQLHFMAHHDTLTGLPNRMMFHDILQQCLYKAQRDKSILGLLFLDLDNFKAVNDSFGHDAGDEMLREVAQILQDALRESDIICRWGGDEFVIGLPDLHGAEDAAVVADKIRNDIVKRYANGRYKEFNIGTSIGISLFPDHSVNPDILVRNADQAMYLAKRFGKGRHHFFTKTLI